MGLLGAPAGAAWVGERWRDGWRGAGGGRSVGLIVIASSDAHAFAGLVGWLSLVGCVAHVARTHCGPGLVRKV